MLIGDVRKAKLALCGRNLESSIFHSLKGLPKMKLTKIILASTTALGLSMTAAMADTNETYTEQDGDNHQLLITQDGNFNDAGFSGDAVTQRNQFTSLGNTLTIDQDGDNNAIGTGQILNRGT